jgi:anti-sigma B factor antagonist
MGFDSVGSDIGSDIGIDMGGGGIARFGIGGFITTLRRRGGHGVLELRGELDISTAPLLEAALLEAQRRFGPRTVLDLRGLAFLDCVGIGVLCRHANRSAPARGWLRLAGASARIERVLRIFRLSETLPMYPSVERALAGTPAEASAADASAARNGGGAGPQLGAIVRRLPTRHPAVVTGIARSLAVRSPSVQSPTVLSRSARRFCGHSERLAPDSEN